METRSSKDQQASQAKKEKLSTSDPASPSRAATDELSSEHFSYLRLLVAVIGSIFLAEVVAMAFIHRLSLPYYWVALIDAGVMIILVAPVLYFLSFRPLILHIDKRRQAEIAARAERQRFNDILETLPGYLVLLTPDYHVTFANRFFRERFGEARGRRCYEYLFGRDTPCEICETYKVLNTMQPGRWEWTGPDSHIYDVYDFPFTDTDGSTLILEMGIDITEQKQAEAQIREMALFPTLNPDGVLQVDATGQIRKLNPAAADMGFVVGAHLTDLVPDLRELDLPACIAAGATQHIQREAHLGESVLLWSVHGAPDLGLAFLYSKDITLHRHVEETVRQLSRIVEQTEDTVVVTNRAGVIEYMNPSFERLTGYTKEEALGKTPRVIKSDHHDQEFYQNLWNTILAGEVFQSEMINRKKNGEIYYEVKTITPLRDTQGNITHFVATGKDISEHKLDEEKLRKAYDELEVRVQERTEELRVANSELEQEICERKRVEATLRQANERLQDQAEELDAQAEELRLQTEELRDINEKLSKSESTLQSILNATQESIWLFSPDGIILMGNMTALSRMNMPVDKIIGKPFSTLMPIDIAQPRMTYLTQVVNTGQPVEFEDRRAGIIFHHNFYPVMDANERITGVVAFSRDITERKQAEEVLRRFELLSANSKDIILFVRREDGRILEVNTAATQTYGYSREELLARSIHELRAPHTQRLTADQMAQADTTGILFETIHIRKDGSVFPVEVSSQGATVGGVRTLISIVRDNTERKRAEEALRLSEEKFARAFANNPAAVALTRLDDGLYLEVNDTWVALTGYSREEVLGRSARKLPIWPSAEAAARFVQELREKGSLRGWEQEFLKKSGEVYVAQLSAQLLTVQNETLILSTLVDITERKRAQEREQQLNRTLKALNRSNQAMLRSRSEAELLDEVCKIIIEDCGHAMVWIGFKEEDEEKTVRPVASAGFEEGYLETLKITWADTERGRGPTGTAIRTGTSRRCRNMLTDPQFAPWREQALKRGYASSIVLPLKREENTFGAITIYSRQPDSFAEEEEKLLTELAGDLAYGIVALRLRAAHAQAEAALRESEEKYRNLFENMTEEVHFWKLVRDENGQILTWRLVDANPPTLKSWGRASVNEIQGKTTDEIFGPGSMDHFMPVVQKIMTEATAYSYEDYFPQLDKHFRFTSVPLGEHFITTGADITIIKKSQEALQNLNAELERRVQERTKKLNALNKKLQNEIKEREEIERQLRIRTTAMEAAANGIVITDPLGNIQWANPALTQISGYDPHDLLRENTRIFNSGKQDTAFYNQLWETILSGQVWRGEITNQRKDGTLYIEEETITPVRDERGHIPHFIAVKQDITQRKRAEEELERRNLELQILSESEHKQRQLSEALVQAALILNKSLKLDEVLVLILGQIKEVISYRLANIALSEGESFYDACHQGDLEWPISNNEFLLESFPLINKVRQPGKPILIPDTRQETSWVTAEDVNTVCSFLSAPLLVEEKTIGFVNLFSDQPGFFTEEMSTRLVAFAAHATVAIQNAWLFEQVRASSERLQSLSRRLVEIQENERLYIARELHDEAGQMLTSLMLDLVTLESQANQPQAVLKKAAEMEEMLSAVSENLHNVAMALRPASLDHLGLVPALRQYVESVGERYKLKASFTAGNFQERLPANMETEIYRIVQEALTNVARHAHASQVDVILTVRDHKLVVIVEDDGKGFDPEKIPQTGHLGLFGMRERAEMIGGELVIESKPGKGTTIMVEVDYDSPIVDRG